MTILRWAWTLLFMCVLFLAVPIFSEPFEYPKWYVGTLLIATVFGVTIWRYGFAPWRALPRWTRVCLVLLFLGDVSSALFSGNLHGSILGAPYRYQGLAFNIFCLLLFICAFVFFRENKKEERQMFVSRLLVLALVLSLFSLATYWTPWPLLDPGRFSNRIFGTLGNPNYLAATLLFFIPLFLTSKHLLCTRLCHWASFCVCVAALAFTGSRSAGVALVGTGILMLAVKKSRSAPGMRAAALSVIAIFSLSLLYQPIVARLHDHMSVTTRVALWQAGWHAYVVHPLLGSGQSSLLRELYPHLAKPLRENTDTVFDHTHSEALDILIARGPLALLGWLGLLLGTVAVYLRQRERDEEVEIFIISLVAVFLYMMVNFSTITIGVLWYSYLGFALGVMHRADLKRGVDNSILT